MITPIGVVTFALVLLALLVGRKWLWVLLILVLPLQAAAVVTFNGGDRETGLNPRFFVMIFACAASVPNALTMARRPSLKCTLPLTLFCSWSIAGAFFLPLILEGKIVVMKYAPVNLLVELDRQPNNLRHSIYLGLCCLSFYCLSIDVARSKPAFRRMLISTFELSAWIATALILWHMLYFYTGVPFPTSFFQNNPGAALNETGALRPDLGNKSVFLRPSGTFSEPSFAALYVVGLFALVLSRYLYDDQKSWRGLAVIFMVFVLVALTSTSGFLGAGLVVLGFVLASLASLGNGRSVGDGGRMLVRLTLAGLAVVLIGAVVIFSIPRFKDELWTLYDLMVSDKLSSDPGGRGKMEQGAIRVFFESHGLGVGLGSCISNTIWGYVLSDTGIIGFVLLGWFGFCVWSIARRAIKLSASWGSSIRAIGTFALGILVVGVLGVEILLEPSFWVILGLIVGMSVAARKDLNQLADLHRRRLSTIQAPSLSET